MSWYTVTSGSVQINQNSPCLDSVHPHPGKQLAAASCPPSVFFQKSYWEPDQCTDPPPPSIEKVSNTSSCYAIVNLAFKVLNLLLTHTSRVLLFDLLMGLPDTVVFGGP